VLIDIGELSADLRGMATQPILLAYKSLVLQWGRK
jgi:hypothetical protein